MIDQLRVLLDRPLDPLAARGVLVLAAAALLGFMVLFVLGASESNRPAAAGPLPEAVPPRPGRSFRALQVKAAPSEPSASRLPRQDPQDEKGSPAASRATKALRSHRALQHVPYRRGGLSIRLVGARGGRAVLVVDAPTISAARSGWRRFLRHCRDSGHSYIPHFTGSRGRGADG